MDKNKLTWQEQVKEVLDTLIPYCGTANIEPRIEDIISICDQAISDACKKQKTDIRLLTKLLDELTQDCYNRGEGAGSFDPMQPLYTENIKKNKQKIIDMLSPSPKESE